MVISKYLTSIEDTEKEAMLIGGMGKLTEEEEIIQLMDKPVVGKIFTALAVLGNSESIADFRQTGHYENIKDWSIAVFDIEKGFVSIHPGPKHLKTAFAVAAAVGAVLIIRKLCKKIKNRGM